MQLKTNKKTVLRKKSQKIKYNLFDLNKPSTKLFAKHMMREQYILTAIFILNIIKVSNKTYSFNERKEKIWLEKE